MSDVKQLIGLVQTAVSEKDELLQLVDIGKELVKEFKPVADEAIDVLQKYMVEKMASLVNRYKAEGFTTDQAIAMAISDTNTLKGLAK